MGRPANCSCMRWQALESSRGLICVRHRDPPLSNCIPLPSRTRLFHHYRKIGSRVARSPEGLPILGMRLPFCEAVSRTCLL